MTWQKAEANPTLGCGHASLAHIAVIALIAFIVAQGCSSGPTTSQSEVTIHLSGHDGPATRSVAITASMPGLDQIDSVVFIVDDAVIAITYESPWCCEWNTRLYPNCSEHGLWAIAYGPSCELSSDTQFTSIRRWVYRNANPAAEYAVSLGYETEIRGGQYGVVIFPDSTICSQWDFFEGKCGRQWSYCEQSGYTLVSRTGSDGFMSRDYGVCIFPDGSECTELGLMECECEAAQGPARIAPPEITRPSSSLSLR